VAPARGSAVRERTLQRRPIQRLDRAADAGRIPRERREIAGVAFERVPGQPALDAQVIQVRVDDERPTTHDQRPRLMTGDQRLMTKD
jgi:hypothetical protein